MAPLSSFQLSLVSIDPALTRAWTNVSRDLPGVEVFEGNILDVDCDAVVSPANSFGFMDGGIDAVYLDHFGDTMQMAVRRQIYEHHGGELIVGAADIVGTGDPLIPWLIAAPTMRVPMKLGDSVHPYLAARAVFRLICYGQFVGGDHHGRPVCDLVRRVAMPGLGTGVGGVSSESCARQVRAAYTDIVLGEYEMPRSWAEASERHQLLYTNQPTRLQ